MPKPRRNSRDLRYPKDIFRDLGKVHPNFFPTPVEIRNPAKGKPFVVKTKECVDQGKTPPDVYRELNPMAHSTNPMAEPVDLRYFEEKIPVWLEEIANTLDTHQVMLPHHPDRFYIVKMSRRPGRVGPMHPIQQGRDRRVHLRLAGLRITRQQAVLRVLGQALGGMLPAGKGTGTDAGEDARGHVRRGGDVRTSHGPAGQGGRQ